MVTGNMEVLDKPGTCAGCHRAFRDHTAPELQSCAAMCEPTQPSEEDLDSERRTGSSSSCSSGQAIPDVQ